jgi:lipopolysaccharide heptosyltransferase II
MVDTIRRTLIIRFSSVGDIILSSLLVRVLRKQFPASTIDFLVKQEYADLVRFNPAISRVVEFPSDGGIADLRRVRAQIHNAAYDLLIDIHDSLRSRYLCFGHSRIARVKKRKIARFLLVKAKWDVYGWFGGSPGVAERYLETVRSLDVNNDGNGLEVFFPETVTALAEKVLVEAGIQSPRALIGICPSARHNNKMWLKEGFAETAATLAREHGGAVLLFGSGKGEETRCREVKEMIEQQSQETPVLNLAGRLSLLETAAMMDRCSIIVTNDSGLMHLATARKRKVVAIFGPTARELGFFPYGTTSTVIENISLSCRPCTHIGLPLCPKGHFKCMNDIHASQVIDAARALMKSSPDR